MPLPDEYLVYPHRTYGMDQDLYPWRPATVRKPISWPDGKAVAALIVVRLEHHMLDPETKPFKHPGAMVTPYPDLRHYTTRDYGNRVGAYRILDALAKAGLKAVFPVNATALGRLAPLIADIAAAGHEIAAYGLATDRIHWSGLDQDIERSMVAEVRQRFADSGLIPRTWLSPARQQSYDTPALLAEHGFDICLDWEMDEVPVTMMTPAGPITALPVLTELDDRVLLVDRTQTEDEWASQVVAAAEWLKHDADRFDGRVLGFTLTPYVAAQPFRMRALRSILAALGGDAAVWSATSVEIADAFAAQSAD